MVDRGCTNEVGVRREFPLQLPQARPVGADPLACRLCRYDLGSPLAVLQPNAGLPRAQCLYGLFRGRKARSGLGDLAAKARHRLKLIDLREDTPARRMAVGPARPIRIHLGFHQQPDEISSFIAEHHRQLRAGVLRRKGQHPAEASHTGISRLQPVDQRRKLLAREPVRDGEARRSRDAGPGAQLRSKPLLRGGICR